MLRQLDRSILQDKRNIWRHRLLFTHPLKNLNSCGDGGFVILNNKNKYEHIKKLTNHGLIDRIFVKPLVMCQEWILFKPQY